MLRRLASSVLRGEAPAFSRNFAAAASGDAWGVDIPTINLPGVSGTYAAAFFTQAKKQGVLDRVQKEVATLRELIDGEAPFREFIRDPTVSGQKKAKVLTEILTELKFTDVTKNLFTLLGDSGRLHESATILAAFEGALGSGATKAVVTSFEPLTEAQKAELSSTLQALTGVSLGIENRVDPFILGGLVVELGDKYIDLSVRSKIKAITTALSSDA